MPIFYCRFNSELSDAIKTLNGLHDFLVLVVLLHPQSSGSVKLKSKDPLDFPEINTNYLSDSEGHDMETMYRGLQYVINLNNTEAFRKYQATLAHPAVPQCDDNYEKYTKDWWYCSIRIASTTVSIKYFKNIYSIILTRTLLRRFFIKNDTSIFFPLF